MKKLVCLCVLSVLVGCGGKKSSGGDSSPNMERYRAALDSIKQGLSSIALEQGEDYNYEYDNDNYMSPVKKAVKIQTSTIILKIEGNKIYKYEERKDLLTGEIKKSVELEKHDPKALEEAIKKYNGRIQNDVLLISGTEDSSWDLEDEGNTKVSWTYKFQAQVNLLTPFCDYSTTTKETNLRITTRGRTTRYADVSKTDVSKCGEIKTKDELRALDLRSIEFCDRLNEDESESSCESNRNMSFLTADL